MEHNSSPIIQVKNNFSIRNNKILDKKENLKGQNENIAASLHLTFSQTRTGSWASPRENIQTVPITSTLSICLWHCRVPFDPRISDCAIIATKSSKRHKPRRHRPNNFEGFLCYCCERGLSVTVTYDHRALVIDGKRRVLQSGSIHYPRSTPEVWPELIRKSKEGGLDVIETYVFWNYHEPVRGQYYFEDRFDLVRFVKTVQEAGLFVHLRIGPYVCAEWNYGGFPMWLHFIPGIQFRTTNDPFKEEMERFLAKIVNLMKEENLFVSQGGPIILAQTLFLGNGRSF
ncbi:unnamed protein product [Ilex paraguariensis]|uniref:beta-galactosidase n=1 Tax=Ilex paraguariensis TaxID=185542 RepID=A0ABC8U5N9_9AQUA